MVPKGDNTKELTNYKYSTSKVYLLFFLNDEVEFR